MYAAYIMFELAAMNFGWNQLYDGRIATFCQLVLQIIIFSIYILYLVVCIRTHSY